MITLRKYQEKAIKNLLTRFDNLMRTSENEVCVLKAPTGSGKTVICAEFLKRFVKESKDHGKFSFIWISVRRLHDQSKDRLEWYYESNNALQCSYFEDLVDNKIDENEILFINWDSINKKDINILVKENEQDNNLNAILRNTKDEGRQIILIIDESHHTASSERSKELIDVISPKITLEVSATPKLQDQASEIEKVSLSDVKEDEMIKSEIAVNPEFSNIKLGSKSATDLVLEQALKKQRELKKMYEKEGSNVNPLVLIQLPDKKEKQEKKKDEVIKKLGEKYNISEENGKMAIWLSEKKSDTLPNIEKPENEVEVLLFKQAIALGWDCPRASILIIFRESKSVIFTIQVIGRIMRMPEQRYYLKEPELNRAFIFTNLSNIEIAEDYAKDYVTVYESKRRNRMYDDIHLKSVYLKRQRERTRLSGKFVDIFSQTAKKWKLKGKITLKPSKIVHKVIVDGKISDVDQTGEIEHKGVRDMGISETELQLWFDDFIRTSCSPFAPRDSGDRMKTALYQFFSKECKLKKYDPEVQQIVLGKENAHLILGAINSAKEEYTAKIVNQLNKKREKIVNEKWEVPTLISCNSNYQIRSADRSIMSPLYVKKPSLPEKKFMDFLDYSDKVVWWFKNGESEIKYFSVSYLNEEDKERAFYVDFIFMLEDGRLGLFDTKGGITAVEAGPRAEGLHKYITKENQHGKNLFGGIVIDVNGVWMYNNNKKYSYDPKDHSEWRILELK